MRGMLTGPTPMPVMVMSPSAPDPPPDDPRELVGHRVDARGVGPLEHDARERLGARVADEDPAAASELPLERGHPLGEPGERLERRLRRHGGLPQPLPEPPPPPPHPP